MPGVHPLLASELYAISHGTTCEGNDECHWCGAPCKKIWVHDDPPNPIIAQGSRLRSMARRPANGYICAGCWLWRRKSITAKFLSGDFKDRQIPSQHSWFIAEEGSWAIRPQDGKPLFERLLSPPGRFVLSLRADLSIPNHIQLALANNNHSVEQDTVLHFTINGILHSYTPAGLEQFCRGKTEDLTPGVLALGRMFGKPVVIEEEKRGRGRPMKKY